MKLLLCGSVVLATSLGLLSCSGDPTSDFHGTPTQILAEPSSIFLDQGTNEAVIVTLVDEAGDPLVGDFAVSAPGTGITIERNPDFLGTNSGFPLESQAQFIVTAGDAPLATAFTLTAGGLSLEIPVKVTPTAIQTAVFSNPNPAVNEPVTVTAEGFTFLPNAVISFAGDSALILGVAEDGSSLTFLPAPGTTGTALIEGIAINFIPTTALSLTTLAELTVAPLTAAPGTDAAATAPSLPVPALGEAAGYFDGPDFVATLDHFYKLPVIEAGVYTITVDWDIGSDIDLFFCENPPAADFSNCPAASFTGHPEEVAVNLVPGDYFLVVEDFEADAAGALIEFLIQHDPPETGEIRRSPSTVRK